MEKKWGGQLLAMRAVPKAREMTFQKENIYFKGIWGFLSFCFYF